ncbi:hypothetical protein TruAng_011092 [Truncatella angustata]|nr:hypothetical protein TruAng_011092 [Truncatella angustata]
MDPASAIGLAAATAQFLGIAIKTTTLCIQIRDNADSSTDLNREIEESIRDVKESRQQLSASSSNQTLRRITDLANKCENLTEDLLQLLQHVRGAGKNISTAKKLFRVMKEGKRVEKLSNLLKEKQRLLESLLVQDISRRFDLQAVEQSQRSALLDSRGQEIVRELLKQQSNINDSTIRLTQDIGSLEVGLTTRLDKTDDIVQTRFDQMQRAADTRSKEAKMKAQRSSEELWRRECQEDFKRSLFFAEMGERRSNIKDAAPGTLNWIFRFEEHHEYKSDSDYESPDLIQWDDFVAWLRSEPSLYWVCGKLGSGKSTLMAHVIDDSRTQTGLELWSRGRRLHVLSFFFWRPGTKLQKSILGLLQSLLYEICQVEAEIVIQLLAELSIDPWRIPTWTEKGLKKAVIAAFGIAQDAQFCIFIDGLDEFLGDYGELVDLIFEIQSLENTKICVASRPELQLVKRLSACKQLHLQDLNHIDIAKYVRQKLSSHVLYCDSTELNGIQYMIISRAEGVFLWAALVTQAVLQGAISADDENTLIQRLERAPEGICDLFEEMLGNVDELHKTSLAFYLKVMDIPCFKTNYYYHPLEHITSVAVITAANMSGPITISESFLKLCKQTETQVVARSAGLLEFRTTHTAEFSYESWKYGCDWFISTTASQPDISMRNLFSPCSRIMYTEPVPYPRVLSYETKTLQWVHRSAHDFICSSQTLEKFGLQLPSSQEVIEKLIEGGMKYFAVAPSYQPGFFDGVTITWFRLEWLLIALRNLERSGSSAALAATDALHAFVCQLDPRELLPSGQEESVLPAEYMFWELCGVNGYLDYVQRRLHIIPPQLYAVMLKITLIFETDDSELQPREADVAHVETPHQISMWSTGSVP